jgi:hypothetical protein
VSDMTIIDLHSPNFRFVGMKHWCNIDKENTKFPESILSQYPLSTSVATCFDEKFNTGFHYGKPMTVRLRNTMVTLRSTRCNS